MSTVESPAAWYWPAAIDEVTSGGMADTILSNAPDAREGFFAVPKVVE